MSVIPLASTARRALPLLAVAIVCALASAAIWLGPGILNTRAGGDSPFLLIRTHELAANLRAGIFPARWMPDAAYGLGYPFFNYYAALPFYLAAALHVVGIDLLVAAKLTQTIGMAAAGGAMWLFAREVFAREILPAPAPRWGAALAACAYVLAPFHLVNVYVRGDSLSEFWAFAWFPLILWAALGVVRAASRLPFALTLAASLAALLLTHNVSALLFAPFITLFALALLAREARSMGLRPAARAALWLIGAAALGLALSAGFWLPALGGTASAQLGEQTTGYFNYANHFRGFTSTPVVQSSLAFDYAVNERGDAFAMGLAQALLIAAGAAAWLIANARARRSLFWPLLVLALFGLATFMITPHSEFIWARAPLLPLAQFPWRFLSVQAAFGAVLAGGVAMVDVRASLAGSKVDARKWLVGAALAMLIGSALARLPNERLNVRGEDVTARSVQLYEWITGNIGTTIRAEYLPKSAQPRPWVGPALLGPPPQALIVEDGVRPDAVRSQLQFASPKEQIWRIRAAQPARVVLPLLHSDEWAAERDGPSAAQAIPLAPYEGSGWVSLRVDEGEGVYRLFRRDAPLQRASGWLAFAALAGIAGLGLMAALRLPRERRDRMWLAITIGAAIVAGTLLLGWLLTPPPEPAAMQTFDYARRPFPHRDPVIFRGADGAAYELIGATIEPPQLRAGDPFTLTLRWRDDRAPALITATHELPMGGEFTKLFRHARDESPGDPRVSAHRVLPDALPGPFVLKLTAADAAGPLEAYMPDGAALRTSIAGQPAPAATLLGPPIVAARTNAPAGAIVTFDNGLALGAMDWFFASEHEACFRPQWHAARADRNRADALQVSIRLRGRDGRMIAQSDGQPQAGLAPTWAWPDGAVIHDSQCVPAAELLEPGEPYTVEIVWYRLADLAPTGEATLRGLRGPGLYDLNEPAP